MTVTKRLAIRGMYPALAVPFDRDYRIIDAEFRTLLRTIDEAPHIAGVAVNGHAGELLSLSANERLRVVQLAREVMSPDKIVISGISTASVPDAIEQLKAARDAGADAALVLPPFDVSPWRKLAAIADAPVRYFSAVAAAGLPLIVFNYAQTSGVTYPTETLVRLAEIDEVVAVKDGVGESQAFQEHLEALAGKLPVLPSKDLPELLGLMLLGAQGALVGAGQIGPAFWGRFVEHVLAGEVAEARAVFLRHLLPIVTHIYAGRFVTPSSNNARAKEALVQLGIFSSSRVRPPEMDVTELDQEHVGIGLARAHLIAEPVRA
jgi:4-hydroxy-tetrahydrodipicolinate synthase